MLDNNKSSTRPNRRQFVKAAGAGAIGTTLAGCAATPGGGKNTLKVGGLYPLSGPYGGPGKKMQQGVKVGIELAKENTENLTIEFTDADSKADPATGRKKAQEMINDGVDIIIGTYSAAVERSVVELANKNQVLSATFGVAPSTFQKGCSLYHFSPASPIWKQDHAVLGHALREGLGKSVYTISANYSWGQTHHKYVKNEVVPKYNGEYLGNTFTQLGQGDFSQALTEARNSGADIIYSPTAGGDMVKLANQAGSYDMFKDHIFMWPVGGLVVAQQIDQKVLSHENFYTGLGWYWKFDNPATKTYVKNYQNKANGEVPSWPSAILYGALRTLISSTKEVGKVDTKEIALQTEGKKIDPQLWNSGEHFRKCNHSSIFPYYLARGKKNPGTNDPYKIVQTVDNYDEIYRSCEETGCTIDR